jgi:hypothetical protein
MGGALSRRIDSLNLREETLSEDGEEMTIVVRPPRGAAWRLLQFLWGFALIHYIFYGLFVLLLAVAFRETLFASAAARLGGAAALALYLPSFLDGSEKRLGRPWDALRLHGVWRLSQGYFPATLRRTTKLDPKKKYVFGWHPHGILILSRIHTYGGNWEALFPNGEISRVGRYADVLRSGLPRDLSVDGRGGRRSQNRREGFKERSECLRVPRGKQGDFRDGPEVEKHRRGASTAQRLRATCDKKRRGVGSRVRVRREEVLQKAQRSRQSPGFPVEDA